MIKIEIAKPAAKKLKILFYGPSGSGKTIAALSFPRVLMIDAESGSDLYAGRPGVAEFYRVRAKTLSEVNEVLDAVEKDNGKTWDTLVIDPVTVLYDVEKNVGSQNNTKDMTFKAWGKVNMRMTALYNRLAALNVHIVVIAREAVEYAGEGQDLKKVGVKPEADKKAMYLFDFVIRLKQDHSGEVEKSRGVELGKGGKIGKVDWKAFEDTAKLYVTGEAVKVESDEEAAKKEMDAWSAENATEWQSKWVGQGMTYDQLKAALKITGRLSEWKGTVSEADAAVEAYRKPITLPPEVTAAKLIQDEPLDDIAQDRLDTLARLEGELVTLYTVSKKKHVDGKGLAAGWKWIGVADILETDGSKQRIDVTLYPEDVDAIRAKGHDFPRIDAPVNIPVILHIENRVIRINRDKLQPKDTSSPFGKPQTQPEMDQQFASIGEPEGNVVF